MALSPRIAPDPEHGVLMRQWAKAQQRFDDLQRAHLAQVQSLEREIQRLRGLLGAAHASVQRPVNRVGQFG
jgi:hypothetical protein